MRGAKSSLKNCLVLTFEAPWTTRNTWGGPHIFSRHPHGLISDRVEWLFNIRGHLPKRMVTSRGVRGFAM